MDTDNLSSASFDARGMLLRRVIITVTVALVVILGLIALWAYRPLDPLPEDARADLVLVSKAVRKMSLYSGEQLLRTYRIALGSEPEGHKRERDDGRTPEGSYVLESRQSGGPYHKAIQLSYPGIQDRISASERGVDPGGPVMIHGVGQRYAWLGRLHAWFDWTDGSIAVSNPEMDEIWRVVPEGTRIVIDP